MWRHRYAVHGHSECGSSPSVRNQASTGRRALPSGRFGPRGLLPAEGAQREHHGRDAPDRERRERPSDVRLARPERDPERVGECRCRQQAGERREGSGRSATGMMIPPSSRNAMNRPFARASVASARSAPARSSPSPPNAIVPSRRASTNSPGEASGPGRQPRTAGRDRHEQDDLPDLHHEDGQHLGRQQAAHASAASRRAASGPRSCVRRRSRSRG